jgi:hypothetical protein
MFMAGKLSTLQGRDVPMSRPGNNEGDRPVEADPADFEDQHTPTTFEGAEPLVPAVSLPPEVPEEDAAEQAAEVVDDEEDPR